MNIKRIIATTTAAAAVTGVIALAAGAPARADGLSMSPPTSSDAATPATTADELSQLHANQQLLEQRLDQLEQIAQVGPAHPQLPPGTASLA
ncbi:MAG TPA: hypothetical protein VME41_04935, partial [Stellaceae bacterium]|nr:hypothetical protein [Stellaceae bacterium]